MKQYPSIPKHLPKRCKVSKFWIFDKLDGSNIRAEWSSKRGFYKFGSRKQLLSGEQGILSKAEHLIREKEDEFTKEFRKARIDRAICFFEFWGNKSFAGNHVANDDHRATLIDISVYKHGFMHPKDFCEFAYCGAFDVPNLIQVGPLTEQLYKDVTNGVLPGMTFEGVVCKGKPDKSGPVMVKVKNQVWIDKVKKNFDPSLWEELL